MSINCLVLIFHLRKQATQDTVLLQFSNHSADRHQAAVTHREILCANKDNDEELANMDVTMHNSKISLKVLGRRDSSFW